MNRPGMPTYAIGVDYGTNSVRALVDKTGALVSRGIYVYQLVVEGKVVTGSIAVAGHRSAGAGREK